MLLDGRIEGFFKLFVVEREDIETIDITLYLIFLLTISFLSFFFFFFRALTRAWITPHLFLSSPFLFRFSCFHSCHFSPCSFLLTVSSPVRSSLFLSLDLPGTSFNSGNIHLIPLWLPSRRKLWSLKSSASLEHGPPRSRFVRY